MTHEPDHLPGEPQPGTGFARGFVLGLAVWAVLVAGICGYQVAAFGYPVCERN